MCTGLEMRGFSPQQSEELASTSSTIAMWLCGRSSSGSWVLGIPAPKTATVDNIHDVYGHDKLVTAIINAMRCERNRVL